MFRGRGFLQRKTIANHRIGPASGRKTIRTAHPKVVEPLRFFDCRTREYRAAIKSPIASKDATVARTSHPVGMSGFAPDTSAAMVENLRRIMSVTP